MAPKKAVKKEEPLKLNMSFEEPKKALNTPRPKKVAKKKAK